MNEGRHFNAFARTFAKLFPINPLILPIHELS